MLTENGNLEQAAQLLGQVEIGAVYNRYQITFCMCENRRLCGIKNSWWSLIGIRRPVYKTTRTVVCILQCDIVCIVEFVPEDSL